MVGSLALDPMFISWKIRMRLLRGSSTTRRTTSETMKDSKAEARIRDYSRHIIITSKEEGINL